jgi:heme-degrading monooxygenase HmoA
MVVEYIRYKVPTSRHREFEEAWSDAQQVLRNAPQCLGYEISHGLEEPENYVVRIEWRSVEEHEQGFRAAPSSLGSSRRSSRSSSRSRRCTTISRLVSRHAMSNVDRAPIDYDSSGRRYAPTPVSSR